MGRFDEIYRHSLDDPEKFWAEAAAGDRLGRAVGASARRVSGAVLPVVCGWPPEHLPQRSRPPRRGRVAPISSALIYDSPVTGTTATFTYRELRDAVARFAGALVAEGVGRGDRVIVYMPMVPEAVIAMLACARIGAVHSVVFGGFAAHELASRIDDAQAEGRSSRPPAASSRARLVPYKPLLDAAIEMVEAKPERCIILQRPQLEGRAPSRARPRLGGGDRRGRAGACVSGRGHRSAVHPLHLGHDRAAEGNRARQRRPRRRTRLDDEAHLRRRARRGLLGGLRRRLGRRPLLHRLCARSSTAARPSLYEGKPVGTPDAGRLLASDRRARVSPRSSPRPPRSGRSGSRTRRATTSAATTSRAFARCSSPASAAIPRRSAGREEKLGVPVIDHWWQTETGWAIAANCLGIERLPVVPGSPTGAVPGWDVRVLDERRARSSRAERSARSWSSCRCRPAPRRRSGTPTSASARSTSPLSRLLPDRRRWLYRRATATSSSCPARTTSSTSPAIASRPARSRRSWPRTRPSPRRAVIGVGGRAERPAAGRLPRPEVRRRDAR